ncbi:MAG: hypothetical protein IT313_04350 [Anaerolineales bacterium]|nr:hypothetical protein [Anaerolineales bacterium]
MTTYTRKNSTYREALELARRLSSRDQRRLRAELAKASGVTLIPPSRDPKKVRSARLLANKIRKTMQAVTAQGSLDEAMRQLRGRSWS